MRKPRLVTEPKCGVVWNEPRWKRGDGSQLSLLSVLAKGDVNCCELPKMDAIENIAPEDQNKVVQQSLFTEEGESAQEVRDRKEQEERRQAEVESVRNEEEARKEEESPRGGKKKNNVFKRWYESLMNMSENFFDDTEDKEHREDNTDNRP